MEKPQFTLAKSTIMMKNEGEWKYINFQKNEYVDMLKQLGRVDSKYLSSLPTEKPTGIALAQVHPYKLRADKDKFDRNVVFEKISEVLSARGVSESDMEFARHLFLDRDDRNLVDHISASYKWDHIDLMNEINEECGFRLYNFVRNSETR